MPATCACGHRADDHEPGCVVDGCPCVQFDWDGDLEAEED